MQSLLLIGIDDTDRIDTPGTGHLARKLRDKLKAIGCEPAGVTRHQLLVDPRIPYTSHNSSACLALASPVDLPKVRELCLEFLRTNAAKGSEPGLCIAQQDELTDELISFGRSAQKQVLQIPQVIALAKQADLWLKSLSEPAQGVIGALSAVALRAGGNDGRFIQLAQIREASGIMSVEQILALGVDKVLDAGQKNLDKSTKVNTMEWLRPRLEDHCAILYVEQTKPGSDIWLPLDRSKSRRIGGSSPGHIDPSR